MLDCRFLVSITLGLLLTGCSPHPATGKWMPESGDASGYTRIHVQYDGKTDFYRAGQEEATLRCFWAGESPEIIGLQCTVAANTAIEKHYQLKVANWEGAELLEAGRVIGRFRRSSMQ